MKIKEFFDPATSTITYVIFDENSKDTVILDPVLDYEPQGSMVSKECFEKVCGFLSGQKLSPQYVVETHAHADHLSSSRLFKKKFPNLKVAIGRHITEVQKAFKKVFNLPDTLPVDGSQFDVLLKEDTEFAVGSLKFKIIHTPGHTPACCSYLFGDSLFTGDALFMPDSGTGRCDFPGGSAKALYNSIHEKLYKLSDSVKTYTCHDYQPDGRELKFMATICEHKKNNIQLKQETSEGDFVKFRNTRDATLTAPRLLFQSVQVNIDAGKLPEVESNQVRYLRIPINVFKPDSVKNIICEDV